jgi:hypothetical protein
MACETVAVASSGHFVTYLEHNFAVELVRLEEVEEMLDVFPVMVLAIWVLLVAMAKVVMMAYL